MRDAVKISTVSFNAKWGDKEANLSRMTGYIEQAVAEGSKFIVFPEMALTGYDDEEDKPLLEKMQYKEAEVIPGPSSLAVAELTKKYGVYVIFGMPERDSDKKDILYNSACVCGPKGVIGGYRKIHLPYPEYHWAKRGEKPLIFDTEWGPVGVGICYDTYCFPELMRYYAAKGCRIHINCTAHAMCHGKTIARTTVEAYAGMNKMFIVSSNLAGIDLYNDFWGSSSIVGPGSGIWDVAYYAGYPFSDLRGHVDKMFSAVIDLGLARRNIFEPNPGINGATDYRPAIYKKLYKELIEDSMYLRTEYDA